MNPLKIATLIPAYKSGHIRTTLKSLADQSYKNFDCYVGDDSPDESVRRVIENSQFVNFLKFRPKIVDGPRAGVALNNIRNLIQLVGDRYDLIHILFDDDVILPEFYKTHAALHSKVQINVSASARYTIDVRGRVLGEPALPKKISEAASATLLLTDRYVAETTISNFDNWVGEYSNMVLRSSATSFFGHWGDDLFHYGLGDLSAAIYSGTRLGFINTRLGAFRRHSAAMTSQISNPTRKSSLLAWVALAATAFGSNLIGENTVRKCIWSVKRLSSLEYPNDEEFRLFISCFDDILSKKELEFSRFNEEWFSFIQKNLQESLGPIIVKKFVYPK